MKELRTILSLLDLTTLEGRDNKASITELCEKARSFADKGLPLPAAVCVYPVFVRQAKKELMNLPVKVASVAGAFPSGQSPLNIRVDEVLYAVNEGADEIDMVISRGRLLEGDESYVREEISAIRKACSNAHLKVILETGELKEDDLIRKASQIAIEEGADFIKTSTGKIQPAATTHSFKIMLEVIREEYLKTGRRIGIKPAGGISDSASALLYFEIVKEIAGEEWLDPRLFRIGASRLADALAADILNYNKKG
jgi:deoxyribose-phosphate aldolase